jgi:hypothetical protein
MKWIPFVRLLALAQIVALARAHARELTPKQRRRVLELARKGPSMTAKQRNELVELLMKTRPRLFAGEVAEKLSPVPLPKRLTRGPKAQRA